MTELSAFISNSTPMMIIALLIGAVVFILVTVRSKKKK